MSYSLDSITDNCYKGTNCLVNKLNIQDEKQLSSVEAHISLAKILMLQKIRCRGILILNIIKPFINLYLKIRMIGQEV